MGARLDISDLSVTVRDSERAFRLRVDRLSLGSGDAVGLSGASGTGKTLLLELLGLLRRPDPVGRFDIQLEDTVVDVAALITGSSMSRDAPTLRGEIFGFVPQSGGLLPFLNVAENIALSQRIARRDDPAWRAELAERLGLQTLSALMPAALSIGQRQRVAIARALAHRPPFVIADEPTAALDPENAEGALALLIEAARAGGSAVLVSSHDLALLDRFDLSRLHLRVISPPGSTTVTSALELAS